MNRRSFFGTAFSSIVLLATSSLAKANDVVKKKNIKKTEWYVTGKLHRTDGPAVEYKDIGKEWWVDGKLHRTDGPAVELN